MGSTLQSSGRSDSDVGDSADERHSRRLKLQLTNIERREGGQKRVKPRAKLPQAILNQGTPEREKNKAI